MFLVEYPHFAHLRKPCFDCPPNMKAVNVIQHMKNEVIKRNAHGIASNQLGYISRIIVIRESNNELLAMINPTIDNHSIDDKITCKEGCLSFPNLFIQKSHPNEVWVVYRNEKGDDMTRRFEGIESVCVQHEIDHLNAKLFFDGVSDFKLKRAIDEANKRGSRYTLKGLRDLAKV
jgi:peptide deformylase